jgi:TPR repeat protein
MHGEAGEPAMARSMWGWKLGGASAIMFAATFSAREVAAESVAERRFALLVGVSEYRHSELPHLQYTERDATELGKELERSGFKVTLLTTSAGKKDPSSAPTRANVEKAVAALLQNVGREAIVLVGLAGHGLQPEGSAEQFFCPADANPATKANLLPLATLARQMQDSGAGAKLLLVDACRNDPDPGRGRAGVGGNLFSLPPRASNFMALFSCCAGQKAYETERAGGGHGVFFYHVLQGLRGDAKDPYAGEVTWDSLSSYVKHRVPGAVRDWIGKNKEQRVHAIANVDRESVVLRRLDGGAVASLRQDRPPQNWLRPLDVKTPEEAERARVELRRAADGGDVTAMLRLAHVLKLGEFWTRIDRPEALRLLRKAAESKDPLALLMQSYMEIEAMDAHVPHWRNVASSSIAALYGRASLESLPQYYLGLSFSVGLAVDLDHQRSFDYTRAASEQGEIGATIRLGYAYRSGHGVAKDLGRAVACYRQGVERGCPLGLVALGSCYETGTGVPKNGEEAARLYRTAAEFGSGYGMAALGYCYAAGIGVPKDDRQAVALYRQGAEQAAPLGLVNLGARLLTGNGIEKDVDKALRFYRKAADFGFARGMSGVGWCHLKGLGVPKDVDEAFRWFEQAADRGDVLGIHNLAMYKYYHGERKDYAKAFQLFQRAADRNYAPAMDWIGYLLMNGQGVKMDSTAAVVWHRRAAELGVAEGMRNLGLAYKAGQGVEKDEKAAFYWLEKAARNGSVVGMRKLAELYERGVGTDMNLAEAGNWYRKAAAKGDQWAKAAAERLNVAKAEVGDEIKPIEGFDDDVPPAVKPPGASR